jgi:hypothetical protein
MSLAQARERSGRRGASDRHEPPALDPPTDAFIREREAAFAGQHSLSRPH